MKTLRLFEVLTPLLYTPIYDSDVNTQFVTETEYLLTDEVPGPGKMIIAYVYFPSFYDTLNREYVTFNKKVQIPVNASVRDITDQFLNVAKKYFKLKSNTQLDE